ncbi:MAG: LamG-like jellyroll fold domain-containing protein [Bacteroidota bacterium]
MRKNFTRTLLLPVIMLVTAQKKLYSFFLFAVLLFSLHSSSAQGVCNSSTQIFGNASVPSTLVNNTFTNQGYNLGGLSAYSNYPNNQKATWVYCVVTKTGVINMNFGNTANADFDWGVWGPFAPGRTIAEICANKMDNLAPILVDNTTGPGLSGSVTATQVGQIYIILMLNWPLITTNCNLNFSGTGSIVQPPAITSFTPAFAANGNTVTISGTNFADVTAVSFGGTAATSFAVVNATTITAVVPPNASGTIKVTTNSGTATSTSTFINITPQTRPGNALNFDGTSNYVATPVGTAFSFGTGDFTIEAWVKLTTSGLFIVAGRYDGTGNDYWLGTNNGKAAFSISGGLLTGATSVNDGKWHHIAGLRSSNTIRIYVDGVLDGSLANSLGASPTGEFRVGAFYNNSSHIISYFFPGSIDEVRVYKSALSVGNIQSDMVNTTSSSPSNLLLYYNFDEGTAEANNAGITTAVDQSGNNAHGILTSFTLNGATSNWVQSYPAVTALSPSVVSAASPAQVTITGTNFGTSAASITGITYGVSGTGNTVVAGTIVWVSPTQIKFTPSALTLGTIYKVIVTVNGTASAVSAATFNAVPQSTVTAISPVNVSTLVPTLVTLTGTNFGNSAADINNIIFTGGPGFTVNTGIVWVDATHIQFQTPAGLPATTTYRATVTVGGQVGTISAPPATFSTLALPVATITPSGPVAFCAPGSVLLTAGTASTYKWLLNGSAISGQTSNTYTATQSGVYTVQVTNAVGDVATSVGITVTVNSLPVITAGSNSPVNSGGTLNLTASGAATYSWTGPNTYTATGATPSINNVSTIHAGLYNVTGTSAANCSATAATTVVINTTPAGALNFDGVNDHIILGSLLTANQSYTKEAWVYWNGVPGASNILSSPDVPLWFEGGKLTTAHNFLGTAVKVKDPVDFPTAQWVHVAATYDAASTTLKLYRSGVLVAFNSSMPAYAAGAFQLGRYGAGNWFDGRMDEVRVWNRALCVEEIVATMNCELPASQTGLIAYYKFNQGTINENNTGITSLADASGNNNSGVLTNFAGTGTVSNWVAGNITGNCAAFTPATAAISGTNSLCINATTVLSNSILGGAWTSSNVSVAAINASGVVTGLTAGTTIITYTTLCGGVSTATVTVNTLPVVSPISTSITAVDYLIVAGGGGGASGGGGGGGVLSGTNFSVASNQSYNITVGAGGSSGNGKIRGTSGGNSTFSTNTAIGGGAGGGNAVNLPLPGGSGGGGGFDQNTLTRAAGTAGQGNTGGRTAFNGFGAGGGGGGASAAGADATTIHIGGNGGNGISSAISGAAAFYGGGGGGGINDNIGTVTPNGGGVGGSGGGGNGSSMGFGAGAFFNGTPGTNGTGGGGGGTDPESTVAGSGGSGIVIIRYPGTPSATGGTITQSGGFTIHTFTNTGSNTFTNTSNSICVGSTTTYTNATAGGVWSSSNTAIATVDNTGKIIGISAGSADISYTVTNANNCSSTVTAAVTVNALPTATITAGSATTFCAGGSVVLTASAGSSYLWSNNATTPTITVNATGNYSVTVTNANNCSATSAITTVTVNALPTITGTLGACAPAGRQLTGSGTPAASNPWISSNTSIATVNNTGIVSAVAAAGGSVGITYTDANGCSSTANFTVFALPPTPTVSVVNNCDGTSVLTASGFTSYQWGNGATGATLTVSTAGTYGVRSVGSLCVSGFASATAAPKTAPIATITATGPTTFCNGGSVVLTASAGSSYLWSNNSTTQSITVSASGNYSVIVTGANNCSATSAETSVTVNALPTATTATTAVSCLGGSDGSINVTASNENPPYQYSKDGGSNYQPGNVFEGLTAGVYTVIVRSATNCLSVAQQVTVGTVPDLIKPVPDIASLPVLTGECSVTVSGVPTATDNCTGAITGTTTDPLSYHLQGTYTITWSYDDRHGNIQTQTQTVIVKDVTAPVANVLNLSIITGECSATVTEAPTATDNCSGMITGTTSDVLSYTAQGTYNITWTFDDGNHNTSTQTQTVIVKDVTAPVANVLNLPVITGECSATVTEAPTATDNCSGMITGTTSDALSYTAQGTYTITWTYDDGNHNTSTQTQTVIVKDVTAPVANVLNLPVITGECSATVTAAPTATDNCSGMITGTTSDALSYTAQGTYTVTWTYDDGNHNTSTQTQTVIVKDVTAPVANVLNLPVITGECSATVTAAPTATDNCSGMITGTTSDALVYTAQGTYTITWTYDDGNHNTSTQTQTVIVKDVTAPVTNVLNLPVITGECSATVTAAPTATDNCSGMITGTTSDALSYTAQGTYFITWTFDDGNHNTSTQTQTVIVKDVTAPVANVLNLPVITGECSATVTEAPTATDNCSGMITGTTSDALSYTAQGTYFITWTFDDGNHNTSTQTQTVIVKDVTAPGANVLNLPVITGECSATVTEAPTATDNCSGMITGTTSDALSYTAQGTYTVTWTYDDGNHNTSTQTQTVIVKDVTAPVANVLNLPVITGECSATVTASPTATDNCSGTITGTTSDALSYTAQGTYTITWTYDDGNHNTSTQTQTVIVKDVTAPVANALNLPVITGECSATVTAAPTATDNCSGMITGTTSDALSYTAQGTYTITWTYDDGNHNTSTQTQTVIVKDVTAPVANVLNLPVITGECSATVTEAPTATDNCSGTITGTTSDALSYTAQGTYTITWTYDDGNHNTSTQTQTVIVKDVTAPVANALNLPVITGECSATVTAAPTATDNCSGTITGTTSDALSYTSQGTYTITWTYDDGNHKTSTQTQTVIVKDVTAPVANVLNLPVITGECSATVTAAPTATDNCSGTITGTTSDALSYTSQGTYTITWTYDDGNHNTSTQTQTVIVKDVTAPVANVLNLPVITGECSATVTEAPTATDNCSGMITGTTSDALSYTAQGTYIITWTYDDGNHNTSTQTQTVIVKDVTAPVANVLNLPVITGECSATVTEAPTATDNCSGMITGTTSDALSYTAQGTYIITWTYDDGNHNTSTQTQTVIVKDVTAPVFVFCQQNINGVIATNASGTAVSYATPVATDNCAVITVRTSGPASGANFPIGTTTVTYTATDPAGNIATCSFNVTVVGILPVINCPSNITVNATTELCGAIVNYTATETTAIPASTITYSIAPGSFFAVGTRTVTATATNAVGSSSCTFTVTVVDNQFPILTGVPSAITVECNAIPAPAFVTAGDNCSTSAPVFTEVRTNGNCTGNYTLTRKWSTTDASNNTTTGIQVITVQDTQSPVLSSAPANAIVECNAVPAAAIVTATDNCSTPTVLFTQASTQNASPANAGYYNYTLTRTWTATDACGNTASKTQVITVQDTQKPIVVCPVVAASCNNQVGNSKTVTLTATDNCGPVTVSYSLSGATVFTGGTSATLTKNFNVGTTQINWTVKDVTGNTNTCTTTVVINALPVAGITAASADTYCNNFVLTGSSTLNGPFTYQWLFNSQTNCSTQQLALGLTNADGIYTLYTTDGNGCRSAVGATYNYQKQNLVNSYTILTYKDAAIGKYNKVLSGSIGVMTSKGDADFKAYSSVTGAGSFVKAPQIDKNGSGIVINSQIIGIATPTLPAMLYNTASTKNLPDYTVAQYAIVTISGNYDKLTVRKGANVIVTGTTFGTINVEYGASIRFTNANLNIESLLVDDGAKDNFYSYIRFAANSSVKISNKVSIGSQVRLNPENNQVTIYMGDLKSDDEKFTVKGGDTKVIANIIMPNGKLRVTATDSDDDDHDNCDHRSHSSWLCKHKNHGHNACNHGAHNASDCNDDVYMTGLFIVESLDSKGNTVIWNSYDCASPTTNIVLNTATPSVQTATSETKTTATTEVAVTEEELKVTVMPNPTTTFFTLKLESKYAIPVNMRVMDGRGRVIDARSKIGANSTIQIGHNYSSGVYYAELIQGSKRKVVQLIKGKG